MIYRRLTVVVLSAALVCFLHACGSSSGGGGGSTTDAGSSGSDAGTTDAGTSVSYGDFTVTLGSTSASLIGLIYNGPEIPTLYYKTSTTLGGCTLYTAFTPYCSSCASGEVCVADGQCEATPSTKSVGTVAVTGLTTAAGTSGLTLNPTTTSTGVIKYSSGLGTTPCTEGDAIGFTPSDGTFALTTHCISRLALTTPSSGYYVIYPIQDFTIGWTSPTNAGQSTVSVEFSPLQHGNEAYKIVCNTDDDGSMTIPQALLNEVITSGGVATAPRLSIARLSTGSATPSTGGSVSLTVKNEATITVDVDGYTCSNIACPSSKPTCSSTYICE